MFSCVNCQGNVTLISGFSVCNCGIRPIQKAITSFHPQPDDYLSFLKNHKPFPLKISQAALDYMSKASKFIRDSKYSKLVLNFSDEMLPWIAGLGDYNSLINHLRGNPTPIKPKNLLIVKTIPNYITGIWIVGRKRIRKLSWHPFGSAFFHLLYNEILPDSPILLFQDILLALKLLNKNRGYHISAPIIAHPELTIFGLNLWLQNEVIAVIEEKNMELLQRIKRSGILYVCRSDLTSWHAPTLIFQAKQKKKPAEISQILISLTRTPPIIVDRENHIWRHARTGQILGIVPLVLEEVLIYGSDRIFLGCISHQGRKVTVGFDNRSIAKSWIEFVCKRENVPFQLDRRIERAFLDILLNTYEKELKTSSEPIFGWNAERSIAFLPYVNFCDDGLKQNYVYLSSYPFGWVPINSLTNISDLLLRHGKLVKWIMDVFKATLEGRNREFVCYCDDKEYAKKVLAKFWIPDNRADHKCWPMIGWNIKIMDRGRKRTGPIIDDFPISITPINILELIRQKRER